MRSTISRAGTARSAVQWFVFPTSMNSMNRRACPRARKYSQSAGGCVVHPALHHTIDLDGQTDGRGGIDAAQHPRDFEPETVEFAAVASSRIGRDVEPVEPGRTEGRCQLLEQPAVGREGDILYRQILFQRADEIGHVGAQEELAAGGALSRRRGRGTPARCVSAPRASSTADRAGTHGPARKSPPACNRGSGNCGGQ